MKHQVVMDVSELEEIKAVAFDNGRKKGRQEYLAELKANLSRQGTPAPYSQPYDQILYVAELLSKDQPKVAEVQGAASRAQVIHRRTRRPNQPKPQPERRLEEQSA